MRCLTVHRLHICLLLWCIRFSRLRLLLMLIRLRRLGLI